MAQVTVVGDAMVIKAEFTTKELKLVERHNPKALCLYELDGNSKSVNFRVGTSRGNEVCSIGKYGVTFPANVRDEDEKATITLILPPENIEGDIREYIADQFGSALRDLSSVEALVESAVKCLKADVKELLESITLV